MKKILTAVAGMILATTALFAQERKPVIGLTEITYAKDFQVISKGWDRIIKRDSSGHITTDIPAEKFPKIESVSSQIRAAFSAAIVNAKRFAVIERTAAELDKIRQENLETNGELISNTPLDFLLTGQIVEYEAIREEAGFFSLASIEKKFKLGVSVKFTDVQSGRIVISETFTKEVKGENVSPNDCAQALANELIAKIITNLYPPTVLSVNSKNNVVQIPNASYKQGDVVEVYSIGEPIIDPYTGQNMGYEEEFVAYVVVFEINGGVAKAAPDPKGEYAKADIQKGQRVRSKINQKKNVIENDSKAIKNMKKAGIIK